MTKNLLRTMGLIVACYVVAGCGRTDVEVLGGGYEEVTYTRTSISEPEAHRISLQHRNPDGKRTMIWPSLYGVNNLITNDVAIFVANKACEPPILDEPRATMPRLFVVKASGLPMDITDEVLWRWAQTTGGDFKKILIACSILYPEMKNNKVEFIFAGQSVMGISDINASYNWGQIEDIMREVKEKGVVRKDRVWGTTYIEKEFKPEVQK